jgi:hypothetical protein
VVACICEPALVIRWRTWPGVSHRTVGRAPGAIRICWLGRCAGKAGWGETGRVSHWGRPSCIMPRSNPYQAAKFDEIWLNIVKMLRGVSTVFEWMRHTITWLGFPTPAGWWWLKSTRLPSPTAATASAAAAQLPARRDQEPGIRLTANNTAFFDVTVATTGRKPSLPYGNWCRYRGGRYGGAVSCGTSVISGFNREAATVRAWLLSRGAARGWYGGHGVLEAGQLLGVISMSPPRLTAVAMPAGGEPSSATRLRLSARDSGAARQRDKTQADNPPTTGPSTGVVR